MMDFDVSKEAIEARREKKSRERTLQFSLATFVAIVIGSRLYWGEWLGWGWMALWFALLCIGIATRGQVYIKQRALRRAAGLEE